MCRRLDSTVVQWINVARCGLLACCCEHISVTKGGTLLAELNNGSQDVSRQTDQHGVVLSLF